MTGLRATMTIPERIVWLFEERVTEAHRDSIEATLEITEEQFTASIAIARDLGIAKGLRLTPVYERLGWWTAEPSRRVAGIAVRESMKRQTGENVRNARVYDEFGALDEFAKYHAASSAGALGAFLDFFEEETGTSAANDYVLERIDAAEHTYVLRS